MNYKIATIVTNVQDILAKAANRLMALKDGKDIVHAGGAFGAAKGGRELRADIDIGKFIRDELAREPWVGTITVEGPAKEEGGEDPAGETVVREEGLWATVDPLDNSQAYKYRGHTAGLPFTIIITILSKKEGAKFSDCIVGGIIDPRTGDIWLGWQENGKYFTTINDASPMPLTVDHLDIGDTPVIGEFFYDKNRQMLVEAFTGQDGAVRNPGSAGYELVAVSDGICAASICRSQKQHELGAAYVIDKGAGCLVVDFHGRDIGERPYDFVTKIPVITACNEAVMQQVLQLLEKSPLFIETRDTTL